MYRWLGKTKFWLRRNGLKLCLFFIWNWSDDDDDDDEAEAEAEENAEEEEEVEEEEGGQVDEKNVSDRSKSENSEQSD